MSRTPMRFSFSGPFHHGDGSGSRGGRGGRGGIVGRDGIVPGIGGIVGRDGIVPGIGGIVGSGGRGGRDADTGGRVGGRDGSGDT